MRQSRNVRLLSRRPPAAVLIAAMLVAALPSAGCIKNLGRDPGWGKPTTLDFHIDKNVVVPDHCAVVFLCDGLQKAIFDQMLAAGELPNIQHYLIERGVYVEQAVTSLPTVTYADISALSTGRYPGHTGILGNKWFDPSRLVSQDYTEIDTMALVCDDIIGPTVYELLDHERSVVVLTQINRGCTRFYENWMRAGVAWFFKMFRTVNMSTTARLQNTAEAANRDKAWPSLVTLYYPSTDEVAHIHGASSSKYREMIRVFDNEVGDAVKAFQKEGLLEHMMLVMVTDHGMVDTPRHLEIRETLRRCGARLYTKALYELPVHYWARVDRFKEPDTIALVDSHRLAKLYFRLPGLTWTHRPTLEEIRRLPEAWARRANSWLDPPVPQGDLIQTLLALDGVLLAVHGDRGYPESHVEIMSTAGDAVVTRVRQDGKKLYSYRVSRGQDPLGYTQAPAAAALSDGRLHTADQWLAATIATEYPDFVSQLPEMFDSPRAGDLALFAQRGWDFANGSHGGHGGLTRDETVVPMVFAAPDLPQGARLPYARTVALVPTLIDWLRGRKDPAIFRYFDADSLLDNLRAARENVPSGAAPPGPAAGN